MGEPQSPEGSQPLAGATHAEPSTAQAKAPDGVQQRADGAPEPVWCIVANVRAQTRHGPGGQEVRSGLKHFSGGARLYYKDAYWGMGGEQVTVIGRHRGSHRYVQLVVARRHLTNWRARLVYSPEVIRLLAGAWPHLDGSEASRKEAESWVASATSWEARNVPENDGE